MHLCHFMIRISQISKIPDSDLGWEDMFHEQQSWFDWVILIIVLSRHTSCCSPTFYVQTLPMTFLLVSASLLNAFYVFTQTRMYQLTLATDPVASPHAKFVPRDRTPQKEEVSKPSSRAALLLTVLAHMYRAFTISFRFLLNMTPPKDKQLPRNGSVERVQQLQVWTPGEIEMALFALYSPVHALLWMALTSANWILLAFIMVAVSMQVSELSCTW